MNLVVDNSVVMAWCFEDEASDYSDVVLEAVAVSEIVVPPIWPLEVANVLLVAERKKRLRRAESRRFIELLERLGFEVEPQYSSRIWDDVLSAARKYHLSSYDASYIELAERRAVPLATVDKGLLSALKRSTAQRFTA